MSNHIVYYNMIKLVPALVCTVVSSIVIQAQGEDYSCNRKPLVIFREIGNDQVNPLRPPRNPIFALYGDGLVIYHAGEAYSRGQYDSVVLNPQETQNLLNILSINEDFWQLNEYYDGSRRQDEKTGDIIMMTHQGMYEIYLWSHKAKKRITIFGDAWRVGKSYPEIPSIIAAFSKKILSYEHEKAERWTPDSIEILLHAVESKEDHEKLMVWPEKWPNPWLRKAAEDMDFSAQAVLSILNIELFSILVDYSQLDSLKKLEKDKSDFILVENENFWKLFGYRFPFPCQDEWLYWSDR